MKNRIVIKIAAYSLLSLACGLNLSAQAQAKKEEKSGITSPNSTFCKIGGNANPFNKTYTCPKCGKISKEGPNTWIITCQFVNVAIPPNNTLQLYEPHRQLVPSCWYGNHRANYTESVSDEVGRDPKGGKIGKILMTCSGGK